MTGFVTESLKREHDRSAFHSSVDALDRYIRDLALQDIKRHIAGCFIALDDKSKIAGFYTLAAASIPLDSLPADLTKRLPHYPVVPAMLMGRLAIASQHQRKGLGRALVADAILRTVRFGIGAFALIVDAKDARAAGFYEANGFASIPGGKRRLFLPIATALRLIEAKKK